MGTQLPSPKRGQTTSFHTIGEVAWANLSFICCVVMIPEQNGLLLYVCVHPRYIVFNKVWCDVPVNRVLHLNGHLSSGYAQRPPFCLRQPYGIGQAIYIFSSCRLLILFFPRLISAVTDWMSVILPHMVCEFMMQVWNVLHAARWKYRMQKKSPKIAIWAPSHNFVGLYLRN